MNAAVVATPIISVVIPTYRLQAEFLAGACESVLAQSFPSLEAVVVHDGSDEILDVIGKFPADRRIKTYKEAKTGYIAALNQGIEQSRGEFIGFCDSDDLFYPDHLLSLYEELIRYPMAGLAFDNVEYFYDSPNLGVPQTGNKKRHLLINENKLAGLAEKDVSVQDVFTDNLISGPAFMVPRWVFSKLGLFDERAFLVNDLHLFYRIGAFHALRLVNYLGIRKRVHQNNLTVLHRHYEYGIKGLENIRDCYPEVYRRIGAPVFNRKLGRKYYRLGVYYSKNGQQNLAEEMFKRAVKIDRSYIGAYFRAKFGKSRTH